MMANAVSSEEGIARETSLMVKMTHKQEFEKFLERASR
jgi:hypothetical protein